MLASWKVFLLLVASCAASEPSRALSLVYQKPYKQIMFYPKRRNRKQRVLFLDEDESRQQYGRGEIDLTVNKDFDSKIKFDDAQDYEFTSPDEVKSDIPSGNERFYEPLPRFRPFQTYPSYYQGRYGRPYAPNFAFDPFHSPVPFAPSRNSFYGVSNGWKARSPRVVFPYASDSVNMVQTNSHGGPGPNQGPGFDNVVFREQNFGLNDIGTDEQSLQDIGSGNGADAFAERGEC
ncbi:hypothetical protein O0L34_g18534 [Tuta absoluta]|nr:hypothetical protein O0L34_g18534 [Tuta absoluta]